jgi:uncharacterized protein YggU (UPF0235/DUF167 family)
MRVTVQAKTKQKVRSIEQYVAGDDSVLAVRVHEPPTKNQANIAIIALLADYFHTAKSNIQLLRGEKSKMKVFEISENG